MKTLEQIKNDYIRDKYLASHDLDTWLDFQNFFANRHPEWFELHWEEVIKIYAMECLKRDSDKIDNSSFRSKSDYIFTVKEVTNENNLIK